MNHAPTATRRTRGIALALLIPGIGMLAASCAKSDDAASKKGAIKVEISDDGCQPRPATAPSGSVTFALSNSGSAKVTEAELKSADGKTKQVQFLCRIDTLDELDYFKNGGILNYVLRQLAA